MTTSLESPPVSTVSAIAAPRPADSAAPSPDAPSQAKYLITAIIVTSIAFVVGVGGGLWLYSGDAALALGVGLFTGFWGGPGFGLMAGMALYTLRVERSE